MAGIDLYGNDAAQIRSAYNTHLRRNASDDEVSGWLSGSYGGGGLNDWINQIANSGEAKQYQPQLPPTVQPRTGTIDPIDPNPPVVGTNPNVSRPQTPTTNDANSQVANWYQQYLGRSASEEELNKWLRGDYGWGGANNLSGIERGIQSSEEAARRRAATPTTSYKNTPYTGFNTAGNDYSAFNTARLQDPGKSAKDAFVYLSNQAPPPPFHDKKALANWFNTYIAPGMNALGHKVISVNEDGFTYSNHEGTFFIDFAQNAGATSGSMLQRLQWNASPADDATRHGRTLVHRWWRLERSQAEFQNRTARGAGYIPTAARSDEPALKSRFHDGGRRSRRNRLKCRRAAIGGGSLCQSSNRRSRSHSVDGIGGTGGSRG